MKKADKSDNDKIIEYLKEDLADCLYIYADICQYGFDDPMMDIWYDGSDEKLFMVLMRYRDSFQIYGDEEKIDYAKVWTFMESYDPKRIQGKRSIIERIAGFSTKDYETEFGEILKIDRFKRLDDDGRIRQAVPDDIDGIADLIMTSPEISGGYTLSSLRDILNEIITMKKGRSFVIEEDGKIIANLSTIVETDIFTINGYMVVEPSHRDKPYGAMLDSFVIRKVNEEGKVQYGLMTDPRRIKLFKAMRNEVVSQYGKLIVI